MGLYLSESYHVEEVQTYRVNSEQLPEEGKNWLFTCLIERSQISLCRTEEIFTSKFPLGDAFATTGSLSLIRTLVGLINVTLPEKW